MKFLIQLPHNDSAFYTPLLGVKRTEIANFPLKFPHLIMSRVAISQIGFSFFQLDFSRLKQHLLITEVGLKKGRKSSMKSVRKIKKC